MKSADKIKISIAQTNSFLTNIPKNISHHSEFIKKAISEKSDLVVFPELSLSGYNLQDSSFDIAVSENEEIFKPLKEFSKEISILIGFPEKGKNGEIYNSSAFFEDGIMVISHRKRYLPTYNVFDESRFFTRGNELTAVNSKLGKIGVLICEDSWHPGLSYLLAYQKIDILAIIAASPYRSQLESESLDAMAKWNSICQAYAATYSLPVIFCNRVGSEDGILFWGGSSVYKAGGLKIEEAPKFEEMLLTCLIDKQEMRRDRFASTQFHDEDVLWQLDQLKKITRTN